MPVDPTDPETFEEDDEDAARDEEVPEADAAEQHAAVRAEHDDPLTGIDRDAVNEADAAEQARIVALDEDDYR
ncbi:hypothetical protein SLUN_26210 [Streptomyces lunaelactis]|uniref:Uncharacterized protein n=1 Tax=Streptomyces lunaelactis TaxID=1535768 RepID=A0A2R4T7P7_9ACTN|nr:hypothetical protein [Streptomyces lunaelactis]AVZ75165.1 hypothetical protein SLUN_26210 [Streptomyces lunaelactis]NUK87486.1 hypothetical protein [Streptomyces lunaelactis]NUL06984.1 hypothetical protein [Streptomyces lunaelactis]